MQNDMPVNGDTLSDESVLGDNIKLLILHKTFNEIFSEEEQKKDEEEKK